MLPSLRTSSSFTHSQVHRKSQRTPWQGSGVREGLRMLSRSHERLEQLSPSITGSMLLAPLPDVAGLAQATLSAIDMREYHLSRLHSLLLMGCRTVPLDTAQYPEYARLLASLRAEVSAELDALRLASVEVVESIVRWRRRRQRPFEPFEWNSHNYLLKMLFDTFFLGLAPTVADATSDPLLLRSFFEAAADERCAAAAAEIDDGLRHSSRSESAHSEAKPRPDVQLARARRKHLCHAFAPQRCHSKQELMRMWAAERMLEAERAHLGSAFEPIAPVMQAEDVHIRKMAALICFGQGEPPDLIGLDASFCRVQRHARDKHREPDPALKRQRPKIRRH